VVRGATQLTGDRVSTSARAVLDVVDAIPEGRVLSYGDVAALAGLASARQVGLVLAQHGHEMPWHRVVMADGSLAAHLKAEQRAMLRAEGVRFAGSSARRGGAKVDMDQARWPAGALRGAP
jgi:methylated-DNA-protein-cysteine methyltransferase related protein